MEIERQFMEIVELAQDDPDLAATKMQAFVTVHRGNNDLDDRDQQCVTAADGYHLKIVAEARAKSIWQLERIRSAMENAAKEPNPQLAAPIYRSIIELFGDKDWDQSEEGMAGRQLLEQAGRICDELTSQLDQSTPSPEAPN